MDLGIGKTYIALIWAAATVLFILWVLGFSIHIGGSLIHLLLVLALIGIVYNLFTGLFSSFIPKRNI